MLEGIGDFGKAAIGIATAAMVGAGLGALIAGNRSGVNMGIASQVALFGAMQLISDKYGSGARLLYVGSALTGAGVIGYLYFQRKQEAPAQPLLGLGFNKTISAEPARSSVMGIS